MVEVVVVGAGFAGLAAAQVLGRAQRDVLLVGAGPTRNAEAEHAHNVLTRDRTPPSELLRLGMDEVRGLPTVAIREEHVEAVRQGEDDLLRVQMGGGKEVAAQVVLIATGARDALPDVPGLQELWGKRAHSCPFCDAEAYAGQRLLILADESQGAMKMTLLAGWTDDLTRVDPADVDHLGLTDGDVVARLKDGSRITADGVFVGATPMPRVACVEEMPLARRGPYLAVDGEGRTNHPGLWAAGDCAWKNGEANPGGQVVASMAAGARAATWIVFDRLGIKPPAPPPVDDPRPPVETAATSITDFWEQHYGQRDQIWSGQPNRRLVDEVADMRPGTALDLGCGEGADAIWLAEQGWNVVAVDVSPTALRRAAKAAAEQGVAERIDWRPCDLGSEFPEGQYDFVNAAYLLSPVALPRVEILKAAAEAVRSGGVLLILSHTGFPPGSNAPHHDMRFPTPHEQLAELGLPEGEWSVEAAEDFECPTSDREGMPPTRIDNVLRLRRQ